MQYFGYIFASYAVTALVLVGLVAWVLIDRRGRLAELAELEASGIRRRSQGSGAGGPAAR
jgi:heme exporter protein D